jgi:hypothetical protein
MAALLPPLVAIHISRNARLPRSAIGRIARRWSRKLSTKGVADQILLCGGIMGILHQRTMSGLTWLTILLTPLTGMPHFVCRCPNGRVKPYCLGLASKASGCCCGCACCRRASEGKCCCCHTGGASSVQATSAAPSPDSHYSVGKTGCAKSLAGQAVFATRTGQRTAWNVPLGEVSPLDSRVLANPITK